MLILLLVATATYLATALMAAVVLGRKFVPGDAIGDADLPHVAVVVAARDEEKTLPVCLEALLAQDYPADRLQIVVVNDYSEDGTSSVVQQFARGDGRIRSVDSAAAGLQPGKAAALAGGIESTPAQVILTTDADCRMPAFCGSSLIDVTVTVRLAPLDAPPSVTWKLMTRFPVSGISLEF